MGDTRLDGGPDAVHADTQRIEGNAERFREGLAPLDLSRPRVVLDQQGALACRHRLEARLETIQIPFGCQALRFPLDFCRGREA